MSWGPATAAKPKLRFKGGERCHCCGEGTLCLNGSVSALGHRIVTCSNCSKVLCAVCGKYAQKGGDKYSCECTH
jgi:hypothetical protein